MESKEVLPQGVEGMEEHVARGIHTRVGGSGGTRGQRYSHKGWRARWNMWPKVLPQGIEGMEEDVRMLKTPHSIAPRAMQA